MGQQGGLGLFETPSLVHVALDNQVLPLSFIFSNIDSNIRNSSPMLGAVVIELHFAKLFLFRKIMIIETSY